MVRSKRRLRLATQVVTVNTGLALKDALERFLNYHRARKHSPKTILHYECCCKIR